MEMNYLSRNVRGQLTAMAGGNVTLHSCLLSSSVVAVRTGERLLSCVSSDVICHVAFT